MTPEEFVSRLEKPRRSGTGWLACCPAHADRTPSLTVTAGRNGGVVVHCFAQCSVEEIVAAVGLQLADLMPEDRPRPLLRGGRLPATMVLEAMALNATMVAILAADMAKGRQLTVEEKDKLFSIAGEFQDAIEVTGATKMRDEFMRKVEDRAAR